MSQIYAVVGSITTAVRLSKELNARHIASKVVHTPDAKSSGCSYSVLTDESGKELLISLSERYKIKRILKSDSDGLYDISG